MANEDLSKLKIEKSGALYRSAKPKKRALWIAVPLSVVLRIIHRRRTEGTATTPREEDLTNTAIRRWRRNMSADEELVKCQ